ncbi:MAG: alpha/beta hydrolase [Candidatus Aminicenantes bacterium]|nr:MAG: alpha/beta hydrolase [Candidatus Aminicenantes bacterium]
MKTFCVCLSICTLVLAFGCKGKEEAAAETEEKTGPVVSEGYVMVDEGVELRYKTIGDGPEAVVIPAAIYMEYEFERLAVESRTLILYDQRGRGKSSAVTDFTKISMDSEIADLEALRQHLGKVKVSLIGWSYLGGMVILYANLYPEHVDRVVQIGPMPPTYDLFVQAASTPLDEESAAQLKKLQEKGLAESDPEKYCTEFWNIYMKRIFHDPDKIGLMRSDKCKCENEMPNNVNMQILSILGKLKEWDWREEVKGLDVPVLTIHGDSDSLPLEGSRMWVSSLRNARLLFVREAGHLPFVEQPEVFYPAVDTFLKGEWPAGAEIFGAPIK